MKLIMKSLLINLIVALFLISCATYPRIDKDKDCNWILKKEAETRHYIKYIKESEIYKKQTKQEVLLTPIVLPLVIVIPFLGKIFDGTYEGSPHYVDNKLQNDLGILEYEAKQKHCPKEYNYEIISDKSHAMHFPH